LIQAAEPKLILASGSATRYALLAAAGLGFTAQAPRVDEQAIKRSAREDGADAGEAALLLAETKARRVRAPGALVIGADQILVHEGRWFDKPAELAEARSHLQSLRGSTHKLATAVACLRDGVTIWHFVARPVLTMRAFSDAFLDAYLAAEGEACLASVGAYRLEGLGAHLFDRVHGEHAAILGLPLLPLLGFLRQHGVLLA